MGQLRDATEEGCSTPGTGMNFFGATVTTSFYTMGTGSKRRQNMKLAIPTAKRWSSDKTEGKAGLEKKICFLASSLAQR